MKKLKIALAVCICSILVACGGGNDKETSTVCSGRVSGYETEIKLKAKGDEVKTIEYKIDQNLGITQEQYDYQKDSIVAMGKGIDGLDISSSFKDGVVTMVMTMELDELDLDSSEMKSLLNGATGFDKSLKSAKTELKDMGLKCK